MTTKDLAAQLDLVIDRAPALRRAGVARVALGELELELAPHVEAGEAQPATPVVEEPADPLDDPMTFGRRTGVPGFPRRKRADDQEPKP